MDLRVHACFFLETSFDIYAALPHNPLVGIPMLTVVETSAFARWAEKLLSIEQANLTPEQKKDVAAFAATLKAAAKVRRIKP